MEKPRIAILLSGGGSNMVTLVNAMQSGSILAEPAFVLSNNSDAGGLQKAHDLGVATDVLDHRPFGQDRVSFEDHLHAMLIEQNIDILCLAGFMRILTSNFIDRWNGRMLNIHPSLLPKYKGLHTHQRALDAGDTEAGCSVHIVTSELDGGPILGQRTENIRPGDTAESLASRVLKHEHILYPEILAKFINSYTKK
jgi:phosphoribosylglycinamide formyltransferase-1